MTTSLKELNQKLDETLEVANKNPDEIPSKTMGGWMNRIAEAKETANRLIDEYKQVLATNSVAIFVNASAQKATEFQTLVRENGGFCLDAAAVYSRLADLVFPTYNQRELHNGAAWSIAQTQRLTLALREVMGELKIKELAAPDRTGSHTYTIKGWSDVQKAIKDTVETTSGTSLTKAYMEQELYRQTRIARYMGNTAPVFIVNAPLVNRNDFAISYGKGATTLDITDETTLDKDFLTTSLKQITSQIKKKKEDK